MWNVECGMRRHPASRIPHPARHAMSWSDILGQDLAKRVLQSHLTSGRVPNAYLLSGPEGVGKRRLAFEMAKALNCASIETKPCDACRSCGQIMRGTHPDVHAVSPEGASVEVKIDQIREVIGRIGLRPYSGAFQVVILEAAERLTEEAANSLLKALEEPPAHTRFLLTTARVADCVPTIVSRCQLLRCQPLPADAVRQILAASQPSDPDIAGTVARLSGGSASRAIELSQRWAAYRGRLARFADPSLAAWAAPPPEPQTRQEVAEFIEAMMLWLRDVALAAAGGSAWVLHDAEREAVARQAQRVDLGRCLETASGLARLRESIDQYVSPRLVASLARERWLSLWHD